MIPGFFQDSEWYRSPLKFLGDNDVYRRDGWVLEIMFTLRIIYLSDFKSDTCILECSIYLFCRSQTPLILFTLKCRGNSKSSRIEIWRLWEDFGDSFGFSTESQSTINRFRNERKQRWNIHEIIFISFWINVGIFVASSIRCYSSSFHYYNVSQHLKNES